MLQCMREIGVHTGAHAFTPISHSHRNMYIRCMSGEEVEMLYANQAKDFEVKGRLKEAERLYIMIEDPDKAIAMYKKHRQYDNMIRLIGVYYKVSS